MDNVTPISQARKIMSSPADAAGLADKVAVHEAAAPPDHGPLEYGRAQVAALVLVEGGTVASIPPQVFSCVRQAGEGGGVIALVGPEKDLGSVRDAAVFAQAFELRRALAELVLIVEDGASTDHPTWPALQAAKAVLDKADPRFMSMTPVKPEGPGPAEQRLAAARKDYDPALNPSTAGILNDSNFDVEVPAAAGPAGDGSHTPL